MSPNGSPSLLSTGLFRGCLVLFSLLLFCSTGFSAIALDPNFGTSGKVILEFPDSSTGYRSSGQRIAVQPGGRIVTIGTFAHLGPDGFAPGIMYAGLTPAGVLDQTYGSAGTTREWDQITSISLSDVYTYADGRILRVSQYFTIQGVTDAKAVRVNAGGFVDTSVSIKIGTSNTIPENVSVRSDGKIVILVTVQTSTDNNYLIRLNPDGSRDTTFGVNGDLLMDLRRTPRPVFVKLLTLPDGKILMAGNMGPFAQDYNEFFLARFNADGSPDKLFGRQGVLRQRFPGGLRGFLTNMLLQPDGKIIVVGGIQNSDTDSLLIRYTSRGKVDSSFGSAGVVVPDFAPGDTDFASSVIVSGDGKVRIAGQAGTPSNFLMARFSAAGSLEDQITTAFTPAQNSAANDLVLQPDGKILVIGFTKNPNPNIFQNVFAIARYTE